MKKLQFFVVCALMLALLLTGCGGETVGGAITPLDTTAGNAATTEATTEATAGADKEVSLGRMEGGVYTNTYAGYGCKLDSNWTFATAEELQDLPDDMKELFADTQMSDAVNNYQQIIDMQAQNTQDLLSVNVTYTKLDLQSKIAYALMSEEDVIDSVLAQEDLLITTYQQMGIENAALKKDTVTFLGEEHTVARMSASIQGVPYYTLQIVNYKLGNYGVTLTLASYGEDKTDSLLELFYKVD